MTAKSTGRLGIYQRLSGNINPADWESDAGNLGMAAFFYASL
jgi:hypothetical protein